MQSTLLAMKWKDEENDLVEILSPGMDKKHISRPNTGRDGLRREILDRLIADRKRNDLITDLNEEGFDRSMIEEVLEELIRNGLVYYPTYDTLRKT